MRKKNVQVLMAENVDLRRELDDVHFRLRMQGAELQHLSSRVEMLIRLAGRPSGRSY